MSLSIIAAGLVLIPQDATMEVPVQDSEELICIVGNPEVIGRMEILRTEIADIGLELEKLERIHDQAAENAQRGREEHRRFNQDRAYQSNKEVNSDLSYFPGTHRGREQGVAIQSSVEHRDNMARRFNNKVEVRNKKVAEFRELETKLRREARPCEG